MEMSPEHQLSPRIRIVARDAVRVAGRRGLFRFVGANADAGVADVVGPVGGSEGLRRVQLADLRSAGKTSRESVAMGFDGLDLSRRAQSWGRRRG